MCFFGGSGGGGIGIGNNGDSGKDGSAGASGSTTTIQTPATSVDPVVMQARQDAVKRNRSANGASSTILSSGNKPRSLGNIATYLTTGVPGVSGAGGKTLLGQ